MRIGHLILREIRHRRFQFAPGLCSVAVAIASLVASLTLLRADELRTAELLDAKRTEIEATVAERERDVERAGRALEDAMREITKNLGFNILILPAEQDLSELHADGSLSKTMPEEYAHKLANSNVVTINHLLPMVTARIDGESLGSKIILTGTRGEVTKAHAIPKQPLQQQVPPGSIVLGHRIHSANGLKVGDDVALRGRKFTVKETYAERGTADDVTVWIDLATAQELLGLQNLVHAILALECNCASSDRLGEVRGEVAKILPGTQVLERGPPALARAEARNEAKLAAAQSLARERSAGREALAQERQSREALRERRERFASILVPLAVAAAGAWIGLLMLGNVRQRTAEIGILRAIGLRSRQILLLFLGKALLLGLAGAALGWGLGYGLGLGFGDLPANAESARRLFLLEGLGLAIVVAPLLAALATWIPATIAAGQDPALVLQRD